MSLDLLVLCTQFIDQFPVILAVVTDFLSEPADLSQLVLCCERTEYFGFASWDEVAAVLF